MNICDLDIEQTRTKCNKQIFFNYFVLIFASTLASYYYSLGGDFFGDDVSRIKLSTELNSLWGVLSGGLMDRPILMLSVWLDKQIFNLNPYYLRLENVFIHSLVAQQLLYLIVQLLCYFKRPFNQKLIFGLVLLFSLHPLNNQAINLVIQRGVLFSAFFGLLSMRYYFFYIQKQRTRCLVLSVIWFSFALLSKSNVIFLPLFYLFFNLIILKNRKQLLHLASFIIPVGVPAYIYLVIGVNSQVSDITLSPLEYFLVQSQVLFTYFKLMILPYGLKYLYDFYAPTNLWFNSSWIYLFLHLLIVFLAYKIIKIREILIWFLGFYLAFLPESSFFPIMHNAFEHRTYFSLMFLFIFITFLFSFLKPKQSRKTFAAIGLIAISYIALNQVRNFQIHSLADWKLHTLKNSHSRHMYNFRFTIDLLKRGYRDELKDIVSKYNKLYPSAAQYKILDEIFKFYEKGRERKNHTFKIISEYLTEFEMIPPLRNDVNLFLINELFGPNVSKDNLLKLEKTLSMQLKIFHHNKDEFITIINSYKNIATQLKDYWLTHLEDQKVNYIEFLRIRTILTFYYAVTDELIQKDVEDAWKRDPTSKVLIRLKEMTQ